MSPEAWLELAMGIVALISAAASSRELVLRLNRPPASTREMLQRSRR